MMLCDFHIHSTFSDGRLTISEIVDFYGQRGFGAIAVTDHLCEQGSFLGKAARFMKRTLTPQTFPKYIETIRLEAARAMKDYGMVLIPGFELTKNSLRYHRSAHMVVLGVEQFLSADQDVKSLLTQVRALGGFSIAAHPVNTENFEPQTYHLWSRREELRSYFDVWEVASGPVIFDQVLRSGLPMIASSDLHHPKQINSWKTLVPKAATPQAIFKSLREQNVEFRFYTDPVAADSTGLLHLNRAAI